MALSLVLMNAPTYISNPDNSTLSRIITTVLVWTEYQQFSKCSNQRPGELVASLGDDKISVAAPHQTLGYTFDVRFCEQ